MEHMAHLLAVLLFTIQRHCEKHEHSFQTLRASAFKTQQIIRTGSSQKQASAQPKKLLLKMNYILKKKGNKTVTMLYATHWLRAPDGTIAFKMERDRHEEKDTKTERETDTEREKETQTERDRKRHADREGEKETQTVRERKRHADKE